MRQALAGQTAEILAPLAKLNILPEILEVPFSFQQYKRSYWRRKLSEKRGKALGHDLSQILTPLH